MMRRDPLRDPQQLIKRVYAYAAYRVGDGPDAEDVTGEVFEHAVRYRDSYDPAKGEPIAWLLGIARRCVASTLARVEPTVAEGIDAPAPGDLETETVARLSLGGALARLPDRDRELIALRYGADLPARDIAGLLNAKTNAVEVALHRALGRLRDDFERTEMSSRSVKEVDPLQKPVQAWARPQKPS
jgi:RNA polymerase sigma factor (sigma-70 family)